MFMMRFDMRAPAWGGSAPDLYAAAIEMAAWGESRGALAAVVCEHHAMSDGYLPSPLILATALAARTTTLPITVAVVVLPLYQPIRLAEDMAVLDIISRGRVSYVAAIGYVPHEYEQHGVDFHRRGRIADEALALLLKAKSGEPFEHEGRRVHVTPSPLTPGGPQVAWGGGSVAAATRAGRNGLSFIAQGGDPSLAQVYEEASRASGHEPGFCMIPPIDTATTVFVADDLDRAWDELGRYLLHDVTSYASINVGNTHTASISTARTVEELRQEDRTHRIVTMEEAVAMVRSGAPLSLQPLVGGVPPEIAWPYFRTVTDDVMPAATGAR
jgi:alkanesulfonate monooxygenase SsuD/methylene tetrahydromethanopterin reductase-like flavin-dependent oxidoreductase (luciferase family)